jgi:hypothetical protein
VLDGSVDTVILVEMALQQLDDWQPREDQAAGDHAAPAIIRIAANCPRHVSSARDRAHAAILYYLENALAVLSPIEWRSATALLYLVAIKPIATGCLLAP